MQKIKIEPAGYMPAAEQQNCADTAKTLAGLGFTTTASEGTKDKLYARVYVEDNPVRIGIGPSASVGEIYYPGDTCVLVGGYEIDNVQFINDTAGSVGKLNLQMAFE